MTYQVTVPKAVRKQIDALPLEILERVAEIIQDLAENPRPNGVTRCSSFSKLESETLIPR